MIERGRLYWVEIGAPIGSRPARRRPVLVVQAHPYNVSRLDTTLVAVVTSNTSLAGMPGNVFVPAAGSGLPRDSVVNVTALVTVNKSELSGPIGRIPDATMREVDAGLRRVLGL